MTPTTATELALDITLPADVTVVGVWEPHPETGATIRRLHWMHPGPDGLTVITSCTQTDTGTLDDAGVYVVCEDADGSEMNTTHARELAYSITLAADRADRINLGTHT